MKDFVKYVAACALVVSFGLIDAPQVFAKAHDQGVADGDRDPGSSQAGGAGVGGRGGISGNVNDGQRGEDASGAGSGNSGDKGLGGEGGASPDNGR